MRIFSTIFSILSSPFLRLTIAIIFFVFSCGQSVILAQVTNLKPDSTLPTNSLVSGSVNQNSQPNGTTFNIIGGTPVRGVLGIDGNLFHSFADFQLKKGHTANFLSQGASNILSRVTGNKVSKLFGTIGVDIGVPSPSDANLFFMNPNGIIFGPGASLDLNGAFYATTADSIQLGNSIFAQEFTQDTTPNNILFSFPPSAFGFLGATPTFPFGSTGALTVKEFTGNASPIILVGRDGTTVPGVEIREGILQNSEGIVSIASVGSEGSVPFTPGLPINTNPLNWGLNALGEIKIHNSGIVNVNGDPGGSVYIRGGKLTLKETRNNPPDGATVHEIRAETTGDTNHPGIAIDIHVEEVDAGRLSDIGKRAGFYASSSPDSAGNAGDIFIRAEEKVTFKNTSIENKVAGEGIGGDVFIDTKEFIMSDFSLIQTDVSNSGDAGSIDIIADTFSIEDSLSRIFSRVANTGPDNIGPDARTPTGNGGEINLTIKEKISIKNGSLDTISAGGSRGGNITVKTANLEIKNGKIISDSEALGNGGNIDITSEEISISGGGGEISARTRGSGKGGGIGISATHIELSNSGKITAETSSPIFGANAGEIKISVKENPKNKFGRKENNQTPLNLGKPQTVLENGVFLSSGASIVANSVKGNRTQSPAGHAGDIEITTPTLSLVGADTHIASLTEGSGNAGNITLNVNSLTVETGTSITSNSTRSLNSASDEYIGDFTDLSVLVDIADPGPSKLNGALISPQGTRVKIFSVGDNNGKSGADLKKNSEIVGLFHGTRFNDAATFFEDDEIAKRPLTECFPKCNFFLNSTFSPGEALTTFKGEPLSGEWKLEIENTDNTGGTFSNWALGTKELSLPTEFPNYDTGLQAWVGKTFITSQTIDLGPNATVQQVSPGNAGNIRIQGMTNGSSAQVVQLTDTSLSSTTLDGQGGSIQILANTINLFGGDTGVEHPLLDTSTLGSGNAGPISIQTNTLTANVQVDDLGNPNFSEDVNAGLLVPLNDSEQKPVIISSNAAIISSNDTLESIEGSAGTITVEGWNDSNPANKVALHNTQLNILGSNGNERGSIDILSKNLFLDTVGIDAVTIGTVSAGDISISSDTILGQDVSIAARSLISDPEETGNTITTFQTPTLLSPSPINNNFLLLSTPTFSSTSFFLQRFNPDFQFVVRALPAQVDGNAGTITMNDLGISNNPQVHLQNAEFKTDAVGNGEGGRINLLSPGPITLLDTSLVANVHKVPTDADNAQPTGNITITTQKLLNINDSVITAETSESRIGGDIKLQAQTVQTTDSLISSNSTLDQANAGAAGSVRIQGVDSAAKKITLNNSTVQTSILGGDTDTTRANIIISAEDLAINNGSQVLATTKGDAPAGEITFNIGKMTTNVERCPSGNTKCSGPIERVQISSSSLGTTTSGAAGSINILLQNGESATQGPIQLANSDISTRSDGTGASGDIEIIGETTLMLTDTAISANVNEVGADEAGGFIGLRVPDLQIQGGSITAETIGSRDAGDVVLKVASLTTQGGTEISSSSLGSTTTGKAGSISIEGPESTVENPLPVPGHIQLTDTAVRTTSEGFGDSGSISLAAEDGIALVNTPLSGDVNKASSTGDTKGASIEVTTSDLELTGSGITAQTTGSRDAGDVVLKVASLTTQGGTEISSSSLGSTTTGKAGSISIEGPESTVENPLPVPGHIQLTDTAVRTTSEGFGDSGSISLAAEDGIALVNTPLSGDVNKASSTGDTKGASIEVTTSDLELTGSGITAQTTGSRDAGDVVLKVASLTTQGGTEISSSSLGSTTTGKAGSISIEGPESTVENPLPVPGHIQLTDTAISTSSEGTGAGGSINVDSTTDVSLSHTTVVATVNNVQKSNDSGDRADIFLTTTETLEITSGGILAETDGSRDAGNVFIDVRNLVTAKGQKEVKVADLLTKRVQISSSSTGKTTQGDQDGKAGSVLIFAANAPSRVATPTSGILHFQDTDIRTDAQGTGAGGLLLLSATGDVLLSNSTLSTSVNNIATGGMDTAPAAITILTPDDLTITSGSITAQTTGSREAGNINFQVGGLTTQEATTALNNSNAGSSRALIQASSTGALTTGGQDGAAGSVIFQVFDQDGRNLGGNKGVISLKDTDIRTNAAKDGQGGTIGITSQKSLSLENTTVSSDVANLGSLANDPTVEASVTLISPEVSIIGGGITAQSSGSRPAGNINFFAKTLNTEAGSKLVPIGDESRKRVLIRSTSTGKETIGPLDGKAGNVTVLGALTPVLGLPVPSSGPVSLHDTDVQTEAEGNGQGGIISMNTLDTLSLDHSTLSVDVNQSLDTPENAAFINLITPKLDMTGGGLTAQARGNRNAGSILLQVDTMKTQGSTRPVVINGQEQQPSVVNGQSLFPVEIRSSSTGENGSLVDPVNPNNGVVDGKAGNIFIVGRETTADTTIPVPRPLDFEHTTFNTASLGTGQGGSIKLKGANRVRLDQTTLSANINNGFDSQGQGAQIEVEGSELLVNNGGITAQSTGTRNSGSIQISAPQAVTLQNTEVSATATQSGNAGTVSLKTAGRFTSTQSEISTKANTGQGGSINLDGGEKLVLDATSITAEVEAGALPGGNIDVKAGTFNPKDPHFGKEQILIQNGSAFSARSSGDGDAGRIDLTTPGTLRIQDSFITSEATEASGGNIKLKADFMVHVMDSTLNASVGGGEGGNIDIDPEFVLVQNSILKAEAGTGNGGSINIVGDVVLIDSFSRQNISVSSQFGQSGTITIDSPIQNLSQAIAPLPEGLVEVAALYNAKCAGQKGGQFSSFTQQGRDRIPLEPGELLPSPFFLSQVAHQQSHMAEPLSSPMTERLQLPGSGLEAALAHATEVFRFPGDCQS